MTAQLRSLLDEAADSRVRADLGERAVAGARRRRTGRAVVVGSMAAVAAVAIGVVLMVQPFRTDAEPLPTDVVSLPSELPGPDGLPSLAEAPMERASAAYVVDGQLVVVSGADGHAAQAVYDLSPGYGLPYDVALSPDGRSALVVHETSPVTRTPLGPQIAPMVLLDLASEDLVSSGLSPAYQGSGDAWLQPKLLAWAPDSSAFACVCIDGVGSPEVWRVTRAGLTGSAKWPGQPTALSWGAAGLLAQVDAVQGEWQPLPGESPDQGGPALVDRALTVALSLDAPRDYLTAGADGYRVVSGTSVVARDSLGGAPLAFVQAATGGYLLVTRPAGSPPGEPPPPAPLDVRFVAADGTVAAVTRLPTGTTSASFAATLVEGPAASG